MEVRSRHCGPGPWDGSGGTEQALRPRTLGREWRYGVGTAALHREALGAVLLTVGRSYAGNDVTHLTLLVDRAGACSYQNLPKYRPYRISNKAPRIGSGGPGLVVRVRGW